MTLTKSMIAATLSATLAAIVTLPACAPTAERRGTGAYVDDKAMEARIKSALTTSPEVKARDINVEVNQGNVQLSGFVDNPEQAEAAVRVTNAVSGVKSIDNAMQVRQ
jgi:osmotically-inducible protein OsmY